MQYSLRMGVGLRTILVGAFIGAAGLTSQAAWAATITEPFSVSAAVGFTLPGDVAGTPFPQFNPALGVLTNVGTRLTGSGTWSGTNSPLVAAFFLESLGNIGGYQYFPTPGSITFNMADTSTDPSELTAFTGTGTAVIDLELDPSGGTGDFNTNGALSGLVTYNYTPRISIPEPLSLVPFCAGFAGLLAGRCFRRRAAT